MYMVCIVVPFLQCNVIFWRYVLKYLLQAFRDIVIDYFAAIFDTHNKMLL